MMLVTVATRWFPSFCAFFLTSTHPTDYTCTETTLNHYYYKDVHAPFVLVSGRFPKAGTFVFTRLPPLFFCSSPSCSLPPFFIPSLPPLPYR